jgi:hypothetical protein
MVSPIAKHRNDLKKRGFVRVEVQVRSADASLVRKVAKKLNADSDQTRFRTVLRKETSESGASFKELLAAAPLDGIDLKRSRDAGRNVKL